MIARQCAAPPIGRLTGMHPVEVGAGSSSFAMPASQWLQSPQGAIANGTLAVLADGPLGCAIQTTLPPATPYTTSELCLRLIQPARAGGRLTALGRLVHAKRSLGLSEVFIHDQDGRLLAHGSSLCFILPAVQVKPEAQPERETREPQATEAQATETQAHHDSPDPHERPVAGEVLAQEVWDRMSGLEVLEAQLAGDLPRPPMSHLFGVRPSAVSEGSATFKLPATRWLCSPLGKVEGGVIAMLADSALASAIQTTLPARTALGMVDLKVNFLRPANPDGEDLVSRATVVHRGRTLAIANADVVNREGKTIALASGSGMILPGRAASLAGVAAD